MSSRAPPPTSARAASTPTPTPTSPHADDASRRMRGSTAEPEPVSRPLAHVDVPDDKVTPPNPDNPAAPTQITPPDPADPAEPGDIIDMETFLQILDLDEENNNDFSRGMAWAYFEQAAGTFADMDKAFAAHDLPTLSSLGHFLKGSSAALGVTKVQASCEQIQHYGELRDERRKVDLQPDEALQRIGDVLGRVKAEYSEAEKWLREYYKGSETGSPHA